MRVALYTIAIGDDPTFRYTLPAMRRYAERVGAAFECCGSVTPGRRVPPDARPNALAVLEKLQLTHLLQRYERVLYLDADVLVSPNAPNIFDECPDPDATYMLEESRFESREASIDFLEQRLGVVASWPRIGTRRAYYNSGVMLLGRGETFLDHVDQEELLKSMRGDLLEQTYFNYLCARQGLTVRDLSPLWNWMNICGPRSRRREAHFIHYAGRGFSRRGFRPWECGRDYHALHADDAHVRLDLAERVRNWQYFFRVAPRVISAELREVSAALRR